MRRIVIGFGHRRRRGKDLCCTLAREYMQRQGRAARVDAFAASLKAMCEIVFGFSHDQLYGPAKHDVDPFWACTPRRILQLAGTEMRRTFGEDIWVRTLERRAQADPHTSILVSDVRFPNEVDCIRRLGGIVVRVDRPEADVPVADMEEDLHSSETALVDYQDWDALIMNDDSVDGLRQKVARLVDRELGRRG